MHVMVLGAGGFIGRHIMTDLLASGHRVTGVVRDDRGLAEAFPTAGFISMDLARATDPNAWHPILDDVDIIVNAAGILRGRTMHAIHVAVPEALCQAAQHAGVARVILISAISARADVPTDYAQTKLAGEEALRSSGVGWTILRPSLVYGDGSYGGTSLLRGMAGLPIAVPLPGDGACAFTPIHAADLARAVRRVCEDDGFAGSTLEPAGPDTFGLKDLLTRYRAWLGLGRARFVRVPLWLMMAFGRAGDMTGAGPISTNSLRQMLAGNGGDGAAFARAIGFDPRGLDQALRARPAQVQDRWHARLYFLAPALRAALILLWLASSWIGWFHGAAQADTLVNALGLPAASANPLLTASCLVDLGIAILIAKGRWPRTTMIAQLAVVSGYTVVIGLALPQLWLDPLGPLLKNIPILMAIAVHGVIGDRR